jgi:hypothetical protein
MGGDLLVDLIAIAPIVIGTILWKFWPPGGMGLASRRQPSKCLAGEEATAAESLWMPPPAKLVNGQRAGAPARSPARPLRANPPARPSYRVGAVCILARHVPHRGSGAARTATPPAICCGALPLMLD